MNAVSEVVVKSVMVKPQTTNIMKIYHYPKDTNYNNPLCGQWSFDTQLKISKVSVTCKKCLGKLDKARLLEN